MVLKFEKATSIQQMDSGGGSGGQTINNQDLTITENGVYTAEEGYTGIGTATVNVPRGGIQTSIAIAPSYTATLGSIVTTVTEEVS